MAEIWNLSWKLDVWGWEEDPGVMVDLESIPETLGAKK